jgi:hypothetical protein
VVKNNDLLKISIKTKGVFIQYYCPRAKLERVLFNIRHAMQGDQQTLTIPAESDRSENLVIINAAQIETVVIDGSFSDPIETECSSVVYLQVM